MKKTLPKTKNNPEGFTLVELLVVISIMAVLAIVGVTLYNNTQKTARDSHRQQDISALSAAMEANYIQGTGYQTVIQGSWFADQVIPANPNPGGAAYYTNTITTSGYTFCAQLETSIGNATSSNAANMPTSTGNFFCKKNNQ